MNYTCTTKVVRQDRQGIFFLNILFLHFYLFFAAILVVIFVVSISRFSTSFQLSKWGEKTPFDPHGDLVYSLKWLEKMCSFECHFAT